MNAPADAAHAPRRRDAQASREALLDAAEALFDEWGYDATTTREIGERACVDAALIARYFGSKEGLYLAALKRARRPVETADPAGVLARLVSRSDERGIGPVGRGMVSATVTDAMREQIREILDGHVLDPLTAELEARGVSHARLRAELLVAVSVGLSLTRAGGALETLTAAPLDELLAVLQPLAEALVGTESS